MDQVTPLPLEKISELFIEDEKQNEWKIKNYISETILFLEASDGEPFRDECPNHNPLTHDKCVGCH